MSDFLEGKTALIFSYGVTNAGKTFTIQGKDGTQQQFNEPCQQSYEVLFGRLSMFWNILGTPKEQGILPRVLDATFQFTGGRQYEAMDLKPYLRNNAQYLDPDQVKQERSTKAAIFASFKEVRWFHIDRSFLRICQMIATVVLSALCPLSRSVILPDPLVVQSPCPVLQVMSHPHPYPTIKQVALRNSTYWTFTVYILNSKRNLKLFQWTLSLACNENQLKGPLQGSSSPLFSF